MGWSPLSPGHVVCRTLATRGDDGEVNSVPRLVATDLDGTIVRHDGTVSARVLEAFAAASVAGARIVFVTGRPPRWMGAVAEATGHTGVGICANGAYVYDMHDEEVLETFAMSIDVAGHATRRVREVLPGAAFGMETVTGFGHEEHYHPRWNPDPLLGVGPIESLFTDEIAKLLVRDDSALGDDMLARTAPVLQGVVEVTHSNVQDSLLELSALGVTKATTLARLAARWGIEQHEVIAFGDMPNDLDMLKWAGRGYAVGNAHPSVLAAADEHAPSIHDDGVALVLERLLGL
jgi:Cof subfamily protein (haloacid dehalogenase superfamily)